MFLNIPFGPWMLISLYVSTQRGSMCESNRCQVAFTVIVKSLRTLKRIMSNWKCRNIVQRYLGNSGHFGKENRNTHSHLHVRSSYKLATSQQFDTDDESSNLWFCHLIPFLQKWLNAMFPVLPSAAWVAEKRRMTSGAWSPWAPTTCHEKSLDTSWVWGRFA